MAGTARNPEPVWGTWLAHQRRDDYWRHGSVCENYDDITCAVFAIGGWADGYSNAVFRLLEHLKAPRLGLVGPWGHTWPEVGFPGPAVGGLTEALRWWDYWLKGIDTGIMREPMLRAYVQDSAEPASFYEVRPGRWVAEPAWPQPGVQDPLRMHLNPGGLSAQPEEEAALLLSSPVNIGATSGEWCAYSTGGLGPELPTDQRADDALSLVFDSAVLDAPLEILGAPVVELTLKSDQPVAQIAVRLNEVALNGESNSGDLGRS